MSTDPVFRDPPRCAWVVHYADRRIVVTSWYVQTLDGTRYPTRELDGVLRVLSFSHSGRTVALIVGGVEMVVTVPLAAAYQSVAMVLAGLVAATGVVAGVVLDSRRNPRWMELRTSWRGTDVVLFRSRSLDEFERVRWALIRALEANRDPLADFP